MDIFELEKKNVKQLSKIAKDLNIPNTNRLKREGLIVKIAQSSLKPKVRMRGGVLRSRMRYRILRANYRIGPEDVCMYLRLVAPLRVAISDLVIGHVRPPRNPNVTTVC